MTTTTSATIPDLPLFQQTVVLTLSPDSNSTLITPPTNNTIKMNPDKTNNGSNGTEMSNGTESSEKDKVLEPFTYVWSMKGKNFRKKLGLAFNHWFGVEGETLEKILEIVDKLHNASLVIDDIEDGSELRRGRPAAHITYGVAMAINAANYVYFDVLNTILDFGSLQAAKIFTEQLLCLHHGQGMELYWRDCHQFQQPQNTNEENENDIPTLEDGNKVTSNKKARNVGLNRLISGLSASLPTEKEYQEVIVKKTSGLFLLLVELLRERSPKPGVGSIDPTRLTQLMGLCFQVRDDLMNLISSEYKETKGFCEDISEGKLSFPVVHTLNKRSFSLEKRARLGTILRMKTNNNGLKEEAFQILKESGAITYTKERLVQLKAEISKEIGNCGGNPMLEQMLAKFWG